MKTPLQHTFYFFLLLVGLLGAPVESPAQILVQDFETLPTLSSFVKSSNPGPGQVNALLEVSTDGLTTFSLAEVQGQKVLRLNKGSNNRVYWMRDEGLGNPAVLKLQFKLQVSAPTGGNDPDGAIGAFYIGEKLVRDRTFPLIEDRFATLELAWAGSNRFLVENRVNNAAAGRYQAASGTTITVYMNNSGASFDYLAPNGQQETLAGGKVDVWASQVKVMDDVQAQAQAGLQQVKFVSRNNNLTGVADFDNLLLEAVPPYRPPVALNPAGGAYTVGSGGDFESLTRPGGVFDALNQLTSITGPFLFRIISDLSQETGEVPLNEVAGASEEHVLEFRPQNGSRAYTISGASSIAEGALLKIRGADWVMFDGRTIGNPDQGLQVEERLVFRNSGTGPTFSFSNGATHNYLGYTHVQGRSLDVNQGVILLNGEGGGNSVNTFEYNEIGGYGTVIPLNAFASYAPNGAPNAEVVLEGNEFWGFGTPAANLKDSPTALWLGAGSQNWSITNNHFYQRQGSSTLSPATPIALRGIHISGGTGYQIRNNYFGGSTPLAGGNALQLVVNATAGAHAAVLPLSVEAAGSSVLFRGNVVANMRLQSAAAPQQDDALAISAVVYAGTVNFVENVFRDLTLALQGAANELQGSWGIYPINFRNKASQQAAGTVVGNQLYKIALQGNLGGAGGSYLVFRGLVAESQASVAQISDNLIRDIQASLSGQLGGDLIGILYEGKANGARIERNLICELNNGGTFTEPISTQHPLPVGVTGIYTQKSSGELLIANNMLALSTPSTQSKTILTGILVNGSAGAPTKILHNTLYAWGVANAAERASYLIKREGSVPLVVKNNILLDTRQTSALNYLLYSASASGFTSDYNLLYQARPSVPAPDFGYLGSNAAANLEQWRQLSQAAAGGALDAHSLAQNVESYFVDPQACNLRIIETGGALSPTIDAGVVVPEVTADIDGVVRVVPDIGANEAFNAWVGQQSTAWNNAGNWSAGVPSCSRDNLLGILPPGTRFRGQLVQYQPYITIPNAYYRNLVILEGASVVMGDRAAVLQQCDVENPLTEGIHNRGIIEYREPGEIRLMGVLENQGVVFPGEGMLTFNGSSTQYINSLEELEVNQLRIAGGGEKVLHDDLLVKNRLLLEQGLIRSFNDDDPQERGMLILGIDATTTGASNEAYVAGTMMKRFKSAKEFVFPVGDQGYLGRVALITETANPTSYKVQYHAAAPPVPTDPASYPAAFQEVAQVSKKEYWSIQRAGGPAPAQVVLYWDSRSGVEGVDKEELVVTRWSRMREMWINEGNAGTEDVPPPSLGRLFSNPGIDDFGTPPDVFWVFTFGALTPTAPLPVEMLSFTAAAKQQDVELQWRTATETNNSHYLVQRSLDGQHFTTLGQVQSKAVQGNSSAELSYHYTDAGVANHLAGRVYYRLEQVDIDGTTTPSKTVLVVLSEKELAIEGVYPNPFEDKLMVRVSGAKTQRVDLRLLDLGGRELLQRQLEVGGRTHSYSLLEGNALPAGVYILEVTTAAFTRQYKVVKK